MRRATRTNLFIGLAIFFGLAVVLGIYAVGRLRHLMENAEVVLIPQLERQMGREVSIGAAHATLGGLVEIEDLRIADGPTFEAGTFLTVESATIEFSRTALLLRPADVAGSIRSIILNTPVVNLVRDEEGHWNIEDLARPRPDVPEPQFRGVVFINNGTINLQDFAAGVDPLPAVNALQNVELSIDARGLPITTFNVSAQGTRGRVGTFRAGATYDAGTDVIDLRTSTDDVDLAYWTEYLNVEEPMRITAGRAGGDLSVRIEKGMPQV
jgi:uncharacterized protein involved in outer membrane biogenesis